MKFRVRAIDSTGAEKIVSIEAANEDAVLAIAKSNGLFPTQITPIVETTSSPVPRVNKPKEALPEKESFPEGTYRYKMVQVPPHIVVKRQNSSGQEAASYLEGVVNDHARQGWEFYRIDSFTVSLESVPPGCLGIFLGATPTHETESHYVITFRRTD